MKHVSTGGAARRVYGCLKVYHTKELRVILGQLAAAAHGQENIL